MLYAPQSTRVVRTKGIKVRTEDTPVLQTFQQALELLGNGRLIVEFDDSPIGTNDPMWGQYRKGGSNTEEDDDQEGL